MHYILHVIHPKVDDVEDYLQDVLAPFNENMDVDPYKEYMSAKGFEEMVSFYTKRGEASKPIFEMLNDWSGGRWEFDSELSDPNLIDDDPDTGYFKWNTYNPNSKWDWWVVGGRWSDYFETGSDTISVTEALAYMEDPKYDWMKQGPHDYVTLAGEWISKELYNPDGVGYDEDDPNSKFPKNPDFKYHEYLTFVSDMDNLMITAVDYHM